MFVLHTINIVKCLNILAQPSGQQSIELNHFNTMHICCPHEYKMFDLNHDLCHWLATFWGCASNSSIRCSTGFCCVKHTTWQSPSEGFFLSTIFVKNKPTKKKNN